jgi:Phage capsid family
MPDLIAELTEERAQLADFAEELASANDFDPESRDWADTKTRGEHLDKRITALREAGEQRAAASRLRDMLTRVPAGRGVATLDVGEQMVRSESWRTYLRNGGGGRAHLMDIELERRAVLTTSFLPAIPDRITAPPPKQQTPLLDVLNNVQVSSGSVQLVTYPAAAPLAGVVPEGTPKPEATITTTTSTITLETLAHWIEVTRQAIADEAMVRDLISGNLMRGVYDKAEASAAAVIQGGTYVAVAGASMLESIRLGVASVQSAGFSPNACLINPVDAASLDGSIWAIGGGFPTINGTLFGMRLIPAAAITAGTAFVGDFNSGAKFLYMGAAQLYVSDSDVGIVAAAAVSNFKRNVLTFLAEMTCKTALVQPSAIVECTPTGGVVGFGAQTGGPGGLESRRPR